MVQVSGFMFSAKNSYPLGLCGAGGAVAGSWGGSKPHSLGDDATLPQFDELFSPAEKFDFSKSNLVFEEAEDEESVGVNSNSCARLSDTGYSKCANLLKTTKLLSSIHGHLRR